MIRIRRFARRLKRQRWEIALAVSILAAMGLLLISEVEHRALAQGHERALRAAWVESRLHELASRLGAAEAAQQAFLETSNERHLHGYRLALPGIVDVLRRLEAAFAAGPDAARLFAGLSSAVAASLDEMEVAVQLAAAAPWNGRPDRLDGTRHGGATDEARELAESLAEEESLLATAAASGWRERLDSSRFGTLAILVMNVILLATLTRSLRRDWRQAHERARLLDRTVRERTRQLDALASRLQQAGEAEKAAMARELHDEIGALLTATKLDIAWARSHLPPDAKRVAARLADATGLLDQGLLAMRRIVEGLRPSALSHFGLCTAARDLAEQVAARAGWRLSMAIPAAMPQLHPDAEIALYRVLQESLTNVARHAHAGRVHVELRADAQRCILEVRDDGRGFSANEVRPASQGLFGMRHRVETLKGWFHVDTRPGVGTQVRAAVPMRGPGASGRAAAGTPALALESSLG